MHGQQQRYEDEERGRTTERERGREGERWMERSGDAERGRGGQGEWYGYIQPYRYYGPGYRGVGYYSVMYQGRGASEEGWQGGTTGFEEEGAQSAQGTQYGWEQGQTSGRFGRSGSMGRGSGPYAGKGPRGYQRSDDRIREDVSDRLAEHGDLDASDIEVRVSGGEVTLSGSVDSRYAKRLAEDLAEDCPGVRDVMNQLRVTEGSGGETQTTSSRRSGQRSTTGTRPADAREGSQSRSPNGQRETAGSSR